MKDDFRLESKRGDSREPPEIELIGTTRIVGTRLGLFSASFNPVTTAHVEMMKRARDRFSLHQVLALIGRTNADKADYECSIEQRVKMMTLALSDDQTLQIGISTHPYFADMVDALDSMVPSGTGLFFIIGFDTFERVRDPEGKYFDKYYRSFSSAAAALDFLVSRSHLIVAGRGPKGYDDLQRTICMESDHVRQRIHYLDLPAELADVSASQVRRLMTEGRSISGLVPPLVERYIAGIGLYGKGDNKC